MNLKELGETNENTLIQIPVIDDEKTMNNYLDGSKHPVIISKKDNVYDAIVAICSTREEEEMKLVDATIHDYLEKCNITSMRKLRYMVIQAQEIENSRKEEKNDFE